MTRTCSAVCLLTSLSVLGCGHGSKLVPDKSANVVLGADTAAVAVVAGVRCSANGDSWHGLPRDLASDITPIKVRFKNHSGAPIQLLYDRFALVGANGRKYRPIPLVPWQAGRERGKVMRPIYASEKFFVAPRLGHLYPTLPPWPNELPRDSAYYQRDYQKWPDELPSFDMLEQGIPEGVLDNGGTISGFLYFDGAVRREDKVLFEADVSEVDRDRQIAQITIPFRFE